MSVRKLAKRKSRSTPSKRKHGVKKHADSASKSASASKEGRSSKKNEPGVEKAGPRRRVKAVAVLPATAAVEAAAPATPAECIAWRDGPVRQRIRLALSKWSNQPVANVTSTVTLGQLSVGTGVPWNEGNQARLVQATNQEDVFEPFQSVMAPPPVLLPSATTVADWEKVVWQMQTPQTFCFVFGS
jgi:hypothetical protein